MLQTATALRLKDPISANLEAQMEPCLRKVSKFHLSSSIPLLLDTLGLEKALRWDMSRYDLWSHSQL